MSIYSIHQYQNEVEKIIHFGGTKKETAIRIAFINLLNDYAKQKGLMVVPEITIKASNGKNVTPDGTLKDILRQDWGYWESKDESDNIDEEIKKKFDKGYPKENILFEDSKTAILIQNGIEVLRVTMNDTEKLHLIITKFINFERPEVTQFRKAIELFKQDIPKVTETLRDIIDSAEKDNPKYLQASEEFLKLCHVSINPDVTNADIREMIIQHILTEDVFNTIFDENQFHRENNIARELEKVIHTFFTGSIRKTALSSVQHYYQAINAAAAGIADHHEKQKFLKVIYETFYKSYNPKAADRLGVVYTPNEIVQFMIKSTDYLLHKHFNKFLEDKGVDILDPATGTGTFICDIIDYISKDKLEYKYKNELHANEVAILPYYISNLNIEFTYTQKMGAYNEFENLCFVDTLDNIGFGFTGKQIDLFVPFSEENSKRIKKQNSRKIAVIIGNPPYNAKQENYNDKNANKAYKEIDKRIKDTYVKNGTAQNQNQVYDMYLKFLRWAGDRINKNGVISFVTNRSFIDALAFDGVRKCFSEEFSAITVVDLGGDIINKTDKSLKTGNVFGIKTGVAILFLVKNVQAKNEQTTINYYSISDQLTKEQKLQWLSENHLKNMSFEHIQPDKKNRWINLTDNDFDTFLPLISKVKKGASNSYAIFSTFSRGVESNRQEWVYDFNKINLSNKINYLINVYHNQLKIGSTELNQSIKWSRELERHLKNNISFSYDNTKIVNSLVRPYTKQFLYLDDKVNSYVYDWLLHENNNLLINFISGISKPFSVLATNLVSDLNSISPAAGGTQCIPLICHDKEGNQIENITDWGYNKFTKKYGKKGITKESIFHYTYAVLHNPAYRKKYELNLKREFPRIPFYEDFKQWANWGKALMDLHINYETVKPFELEEITTETKEQPKTKLKANKEIGEIVIDENTTLINIPVEAWTYKLGNRSALEWILDQYKESKPKDPTILEKFNTYKFTDYKLQVIDLLKRVCTVSVETMKIIKEMEKIETH